MEQALLLLTLIIYLAAFVSLITRVRDRICHGLIWLAILSHLSALAFRSIVAGHPPFTNLYETILLLSFLLALRLVLWRRQIERRYSWIILLTIMGLIGTALGMPSSYKTIRPLMPALNSIWMYLHVPAYFFGYMALVLAFIYVMIFLLRGKNESSSETINLIRRLDNEVRIAFLFLNIGLVTGAIWAYHSWGNYWAWDPKEVWALINILTLALYFHLLKPKGIKKVFIVILTFLTVVFTYLGVSFLLRGIHSYL
ncbi:MAG: cytochrome c biogenesis protein CcsA [Candidatus Neomarinimicrobiota bacterium]